MNVHNNIDTQLRAYQRWAPVYDRVYRRILLDAHRKTASAAARAGLDILEIGVGTGLVLPHYPASARVTGIDASPHMIAKAQAKLRAGHLGHVKHVAVMDACHLDFAAATFAAVTVPFVITLVPDPERALDECARVLEPSGEIIISSKLSDSRGAWARVEEFAAPLAARIGLSSSFKLDRIKAWAEQRGDFEVLEVTPFFPAGFFKLMRLKKRA